MTRRKHEQPAEPEQPTQPDGMPGNSDAQEKVFPEDNPARTVGDQPSGATDPLHDPTHDDMTRPGADTVIGVQDQGPEAAKTLPKRAMGNEVTDDEIEAQRKREGIVIGDGGVRGQNPYIIRGADAPEQMSAPKIDPIVNQANVELPTGAVKRDMGSKERTDGVSEVAAKSVKDDPKFAEGYAYAMKQARGEI